MATIEKRGDSYKITVSCGYNSKGVQQRRRMTWTPTPGMTARQIDKELNRQATLFEERCRSGDVASGSVKFETFAAEWLDKYAEKQLKERTIMLYRQMTVRVYAALGAARIDRITPAHIQSFLDNLQEKGVNLSKANAPLSAKTVRNYNAFISAVMASAVKRGIIVNNPCTRVTLPPMQRPTRNHDIFTPDEAARFLALLESEDMQYRVFFTLAVYTGMRKGEILGLEWPDVDLDSGTLDIVRTSQYTKRSGVYEDTPKTERSARVLKLSQIIVDLLRQYRAVQDDNAAQLGTQWHDTGRLFTKWNGEPLFPTAPLNWLRRFCERTGTRQVSIHSLRHLNASLLINAGVDVKTTSAVLGHSNATTTLTVYSHEFASAKARAADAVADALDLGQNKESPAE